MQYNPDSLDSKITLLLHNQEKGERERNIARSEILLELKEIKVNLQSFDQRLTKVETIITEHEKLNREIKPIIETYKTGKYTWYSFKNIAIGVSFILAVAANILMFTKK